MKATLLLLLLLPVAAVAQSAREGLYGGISTGISHYKTNWYYYRSDGRPSHYNFPVHTSNRVVIGLNLEKKAFVQLNKIDLDLGGELLFGPGGKTKGDWLPQEEDVSEGGWMAGINGMVKAAYALPGGGQLGLAPFLGLGPQFSMLHNKGTDKGDFAPASYYSYSGGWNEYVLLLNGTAGIDIRFSSFTLTPQVHLGIIGYSFTDWEPNEEGVEMETSPRMFGFSLKIARRF